MISRKELQKRNENPLLEKNHDDGLQTTSARKKEMESLNFNFMMVCGVLQASHVRWPNL